MANEEIKKLFSATDAEAIRKIRHDLRTPLAVIQGAVELLRDANTSQQPPSIRTLERIERAVNQMEQTIVDVFAIADDGKGHCDLVHPSNLTLPGDVTHKDMEGILDGRTILCAEDNESNREILVELVSSLGCTALPARDGQEVLDILQRTDVDVVLMDLEMPLINGFGATAAIRNNPDHAFLPIVALSAHTSNTMIQKVEQSGMNGYLIKPIDRDSLSSAISRVLLSDGPTSFVRDERISEEQAGTIDIHATLDSVAGVGRVGGNESIYEELLKKFIDQQSVIKEVLWDLLDSAREGEAIRICHNLKSVSGNLGANRVYAIASDLESALQRSEADKVIGYIDTLHAEILSANSAIKDYLSSRCGQKSRPSKDRPFDEELKELLFYLRDDISIAMEKIESMSLKHQNSPHGDVVRELKAAIDSFDSDTASGLIRRVLEK